jgi:hypothetical protein
LGIGDCRLAIRLRQTQAGRQRCAPNKANLLRFWAKNEGRRKNKANRRGRGGRDWGLEIWDWGFEYAGAVPVWAKCQTNPISAFLA